VLAHVSPSPVVELNRAVAIGMAAGPAKGLEITEPLRHQRALEHYPQLPPSAATSWPSSAAWTRPPGEFERAAALTHNERERAVFLTPAAACADSRPQVLTPLVVMNWLATLSPPGGLYQRR
jgi:predicted RNA polymerase sigma factor